MVSILKFAKKKRIGQINLINETNSSCELNVKVTSSDIINITVSLTDLPAKKSEDL